MITVVKIVVKDFRLNLLIREFRSSIVPNHGIFLAGFSRIKNGIFTPNSDVEEVYRGGPSLADPGEIRFDFKEALTSAQDTELDNVLAAHNAGTSSSEQARQEQDVLDAQAHLADYPNYDSMTPPQKLVVDQRSVRLIARDYLGPKAPI